MAPVDEVREWEARGTTRLVDGHSIWVLDAPALDDRGLDPLLVLHGFPSCSFDWRSVLDALRAHRRVVALDFLGFGLSDKPDLRYSMRLQADMVEGVARSARAHVGRAADARHGRHRRRRAAGPRASKGRCRSR